MSEGPLLVTGGLGYVGGRLIPALRKAVPTREVRLFTRRPPGRRPNWANDLPVFRGDLHSSSDLGPALRGVETIVHLAGPDREECNQDPRKAVADRVGGTVALIGAARKAGVRRLLYLSTFHVYGQPGSDPITEETVPRPADTYAFTHLAAEHFLLAEARLGAMAGLVFRLSNSYGCPADAPVNQWGYAFLGFCDQAARTEQIVLTGSGQAHRDFISLGDVARAVELALAWPDERWRGEVFNLGGECSLSMKEVADRIAAAAQRRDGPPVEIRTGRAAGPHEGRPVDYRIDRLKAEGFTPRHDWEAEIAATLALCRGHRA